MNSIHAIKTIFKRSKKGQSLAEYGLILALIAVICIGGLTALGGQINGGLTTLSGTIGGALGG
jgi:pilus assembly protein Flp/PilA